MLPIPPAVQARHEEHLGRRAIPKSLRGFCRKYRFPPADEQSLPGLTRKSQVKKQTKAQQHRAAAARLGIDSFLVETRLILEKNLERIKGKGACQADPDRFSPGQSLNRVEPAPKT